MAHVQPVIPTRMSGSGSVTVSMPASLNRSSDTPSTCSQHWARSTPRATQFLISRSDRFARSTSRNVRPKRLQLRREAVNQRVSSRRARAAPRPAEAVRRSVTPVLPARRVNVVGRTADALRCQCLPAIPEGSGRRPTDIPAQPPARPCWQAHPIVQWRKHSRRRGLPAVCIIPNSHAAPAIERVGLQCEARARARGRAGFPSISASGEPARTRVSIIGRSMSTGQASLHAPHSDEACAR